MFYHLLVPLLGTLCYCGSTPPGYQCVVIGLLLRWLSGRLIFDVIAFYRVYVEVVFEYVALVDPSIARGLIGHRVVVLLSLLIADDLRLIVLLLLLQAKPLTLTAPHYFKL